MTVMILNIVNDDDNDKAILVRMIRTKKVKLIMILMLVTAMFVLVFRCQSSRF